MDVLLFWVVTEVGDDFFLLDLFLTIVFFAIFFLFFIARLPTFVVSFSGLETFLHEVVETFLRIVLTFTFLRWRLELLIVRDRGLRGGLTVNGAGTENNCGVEGLSLFSSKQTRHLAEVGSDGQLPTISMSIVRCNTCGLLDSSSTHHSCHLLH